MNLVREGRIPLNEQSEINKSAWEYRAYEFWNKRDGSPKDKAKEILKNPKASLKNTKNILMTLMERTWQISADQMEEKLFPFLY